MSTNSVSCFLLMMAGLATVSGMNGGNSNSKYPKIGCGWDTSGQPRCHLFFEDLYYGNDPNLYNLDYDKDKTNFIVKIYQYDEGTSTSKFSTAVSDHISLERISLNDFFSSNGKMVKNLGACTYCESNACIFKGSEASTTSNDGDSVVFHVLICRIVNQNLLDINFRGSIRGNLDHWRHIQHFASEFGGDSQSGIFSIAYGKLMTTDGYSGTGKLLYDKSAMNSGSFPFKGTYCRSSRGGTNHLFNNFLLNDSRTYALYNIGQTGTEILPITGLAYRSGQKCANIDAYTGRVPVFIENNEIVGGNFYFGTSLNPQRFENKMSLAELNRGKQLSGQLFRVI